MIIRRTAVAAMAVLSLATVAAACGEERENVADKPLSGVVYDPPISVAGLSLPDTAGGDFAMQPQSGNLNMIYFGYMGCPDVCPTTLAEVKKALGMLPKDERARVTLSMETIDPDRDTPEEITAYVQGFVPDAHAMQTTDQDLLMKVTKAFCASYSITTNDAGEIEVGHSANLYIVDANGDIVVIWPFGISAQQISDDLQILFARGVA